MEKAKITPIVLQVLLREGVDPEAVSLLVRDQETGRRFFTDGVSRRGYNFLVVTLDGGGWGWLPTSAAGPQNPPPPLPLLLSLNSSPATTNPPGALRGPSARGGKPQKGSHHEKPKSHP